jgi:hypothetical protein
MRRSSPSESPAAPRPGVPVTPSDASAGGGLHAWGASLRVAVVVVVGSAVLAARGFPSWASCLIGLPAIIATLPWRRRHPDAPDPNPPPPAASGRPGRWGPRAERPTYRRRPRVGD